MSDRRFLVLLISALTALVAIGIVVLAAVGLHDPIHRDFDTGDVTDTSRMLLALITLGAVLFLGGAGTVVTLLRLQLRRQTWINAFRSPRGARPQCLLLGTGPHVAGRR